MGSLSPQVFDVIEDVHQALSFNPLNGRGETAESSSSANASTAIIKIKLNTGLVLVFANFNISLCDS